MTGYISSVNYLSLLTVYSLIDLGYSVNLASQYISTTFNVATASSRIPSDKEVRLEMVGCTDGMPTPIGVRMPTGKTIPSLDDRFVIYSESS